MNHPNDIQIFELFECTNNFNELKNRMIALMHKTAFFLRQTTRLPVEVLPAGGGGCTQAFIPRSFQQQSIPAASWSFQKEGVSSCGPLGGSSFCYPCGVLPAGGCGLMQLLIYCCPSASWERSHGTPHPPWTDWLTDKHVWKHYLPANYVCGR